MGSYFSANGRISRKTYWLNWLLPVIGLQIVAAVLDVLFSPVDPSSGERIGIFGALLALILFWPSIAMTAKRLHDRGMTGWWQIAPISVIIPAVAAYWYLNKPDAASAPVDPLVGSAVGIALIVIVAFVVLYPAINTLFLRGLPGPNKYGPDPLESEG
jgi:uncharacterized membrane protein YhaH (DUF805 family)